MGLEINHEPKEKNAMAMFTVQERLCLTEDDRIVLEGDLDARWLYAIPGQEIPLAEAERYGLTGGEPNASERVPASEKTVDEMTGKELDAFAAELGVDWDVKAKLPEKRDALKAAAKAKLDEAADGGAGEQSDGGEDDAA